MIRWLDWFTKQSDAPVYEYGSLAHVKHLLDYRIASTPSKSAFRTTQFRSEYRNVARLLFHISLVTTAFQSESSRKVIVPTVSQIDVTLDEYFTDEQGYTLDFSLTFETIQNEMCELVSRYEYVLEYTDLGQYFADLLTRPIWREYVNLVETLQPLRL